MKIKLAIVDDHPIVRNGLVLLLASQPDMTVAGDFGTAQALYAALQNGLEIDVLLLDLQLPDESGRDVLNKVSLSHPAIKTLILTSLESALLIRNLLQSGAKGYILKTTGHDEIITAVRAIMQDDIYLSQEIKDILVKSTLSNKTALGFDGDLSERELQILQLLAEECTSAEIGQRIHLSARTVENYRLGLIQKLQVKNVAGLIKKAIFMGLIK